MNARKLLLDEKVEVRQFEEGLQGSWYSAVVVGVADMSREVKYDELLSETEDSMLVESIPVTGEIEGVYQRPCVRTNHRGRIRPLPPNSDASSMKDGLKFGFSVDAFFEDAWWEGVIIDSNDESDKRLVYFPDEGDEQRLKVSDLRVTHEWDEFSGSWRERGVWTLVKLVEECKANVSLGKFTKFVWSHLRVNFGFLKMISEWTCGAYSIWKEYFMDVVSVVATKSFSRAHGFPTTSQVATVRRKGNSCRRFQLSGKDHTLVPIKTGRGKNGKKSIPSIKSKQPEPRDLKKVDFPFDSGAHSSSLEADALSESSEVAITGRGTSCNFDEIPNACGVHVKSGVNDAATTSGASVKNNKEQSQTRTVLSRRKMQQVDDNPAVQKLNPFLVHQRQQIRFISKSRKQRNVTTGALTGHANKTKGLMRRQMDQNLPSRFPNHDFKVASFSLRKRRSCLKVKRRIPKTIQRSNTKTKLSCNREGSGSELSRNELNNIDLKSDLLHQLEPKDTAPDKHKSKKSRRNDPVCFVCQYGNNLLPCDNCTSSYHIACLGLKEVPDGNWFCPSCSCGLCGSRSSSEDELFSEVCYQCSRQYHLDCLKGTGPSDLEDSLPKKFCSKSCLEICVRLHDHMQTLYPTSLEGISWNIARSRRNDYNIRDERVHPHVQLSQVMNVLHECFEPTIEPHTKKDLVAEVVYNSSSKFKRLDFHGFYVMVLLNQEEVACVATLRIHGRKVAEMPLVATPFKYRRRGMCRILLQEMEKMLVELGVERLVLPAISQLRETWVNVFGFEEMPAPLSQELAGYPFLVFGGTTMFHKVLRESYLAEYPSRAQEAKNTVAEGSQEHESDNTKKFGLCYKRKQRFKAVSKDQTRETGLCYKRRRGHESRGVEKMKTPVLYYTRRRQPQTVGKHQRVTQASNRCISPAKYVYKRRRVLATMEAVH